MGYKDGEEDQGRRRTRSAARGVPATPPPATKKEKKATPSSGAGRNIYLTSKEKLLTYYLHSRLWATWPATKEGCQ